MRLKTFFDSGSAADLPLCKAYVYSLYDMFRNFKAEVPIGQQLSRKQQLILREVSNFDVGGAIDFVFDKEVNTVKAHVNKLLGKNADKVFWNDFNVY